MIEPNFVIMKTQNSITEWILLGSSAPFFGGGWIPFHFYTTRVFAAAGSKGLAFPYSILRICFGALPVCAALYCFYMGCFQAKSSV